MTFQLLGNTTRLVFFGVQLEKAGGRNRYKQLYQLRLEQVGVFGGEMTERRTAYDRLNNLRVLSLPSSCRKSDNTTQKRARPSHDNLPSCRQKRKNNKKKKKNIGQGQLQKTIRMIIVEGAGWIGWSISDGGFATTPTTKHQPELPEESSSPASMVTGGLSFLSAARSFSFLRCLLGCCGSHSFVTTVMTPKRQ